MGKRIIFALLAIFALLFAIVPHVVADDIAVGEVDEDDEVNVGQTAFGSGATSVESTGQDEAEDEIPDPHNHVSTGSIVPQYPDLHFPLGGIVEIICGFRNKAAEPLNITRITGSLNFAGDFKYYIQNFSMMEFGNTVVPAGHEVSLSYPIRTDPGLEPRDYIVATTVWYESADGREEFANTFFNSTVELYEAESGFNSTVLFSVIAIAALLALAGAVVYRTFLAGKLGKKSSRRPREMGTKGDQTTHDFISDILPSSGRKTPTRRPTTPKKDQ